MAHTVVMQVTLTGDAEEGMKMLDDSASSRSHSRSPDSQRGMWMHSEAMTGTGVIVFDTAAHASDTLEVLKPPPGGPTVLNSAVFNIAREV